MNNELERRKDLERIGKLERELAEFKLKCGMSEKSKSSLFLFVSAKLRHFFIHNLGMVLLFLTSVVFHLMAYFTVKSFYSTHLPHYDSMGTYTMMFQIINTYHLEGFRSALNIALSYHLSWLQSFFALMGAPFLNTTPESVQIYNSLAVFLFMLSVYLAAKSAGASELKSYLLSLMVFLPDVFYDWQGGLLDLQRDPSFVLLLGATYFTFFAITMEPSFKKGILLGFFAGLTILSRGNALFLLVAIMAPIVGLGIIWKIYSKDFKIILKGLLPAASSFLLVAGTNLYYALLPNISRYQNPFVAYSIGDDAMLSVASHWSKPIQIMFGRIGEFGGHTYGTLFVVIGGFFFLAIILAFLRYKGLVKYDLAYLFTLKNIAMIVAGIWTIAITIFLMCFIIKLKPLDFGQSKFPFYPSLLGFFMIFFVLGYSVHLNSEKTKRSRIYALAGLLCLSIFVLGAVRLRYHTPEATPKYVEFAKEMAEFFTSQDKPKVIAFMWHDTISIDTLKFYLAEKGSKQPVKFLYTAPDGNQKLDFAVVAPPGIDIPALLLTMKKEIEDGADYIVLATKPRAYAINHHMLIFKYGQTVVDSLMRSDKFRVVFTYELWGMPFAVLENKGRIKT